jgi:hypothetical protein
MNDVTQKLSVLSAVVGDVSFENQQYFLFNFEKFMEIPHNLWARALRFGVNHSTGLNSLPDWSEFFLGDYLAEKFRSHVPGLDAWMRREDLKGLTAEAAQAMFVDRCPSTISDRHVKIQAAWACVAGTSANVEKLRQFLGAQIETDPPGVDFATFKKWRNIWFSAGDAIEFVYMWEILKAAGGEFMPVPRDVPTFFKTCWAPLEKALPTKSRWITLWREGYAIEKLARSLRDEDGKSVDYQRYINCWEGAKKNESLELIPAFRISMPGGYTVRTIASDDPTMMFVGLITGCCQHLKGAAATCVTHGTWHPESRFVVFEKDGQIRAQSWVWADSVDTEDGLGDAIVFDSIETLNKSEEWNNTLALLMVKVSEHMFYTHGISVAIGDTGYGASKSVRKILQSLGQTHKVHLNPPANAPKYMDGDEAQWQIDLAMTSF